MFAIDFIECNDAETLLSDPIHFCNNIHRYVKFAIFSLYKKNLYFSPKVLIISIEGFQTSTVQLFQAMQT